MSSHNVRNELVDSGNEVLSVTDGEMLDRDIWREHVTIEPGAGAETRKLPVAGHGNYSVKIAVLTGGGGAVTVTAVDGTDLDESGNSQIAFASGGWAIFDSFRRDTGYEWRIINHEGGVLS